VSKPHTLCCCLSELRVNGCGPLQEIGLDDDAHQGGVEKFAEVIADPEYTAPAYIHKRAPKKKKKDDPVARGRRHREEQSRFGVPGQNRHTQLRWNVREQLRENAVGLFSPTLLPDAAVPTHLPCRLPTAAQVF
jgi:hypothetical protein